MNIKSKNKVSDAEALSKEAEKELTTTAIQIRRRIQMTSNEDKDQIVLDDGERTFVASEELEIPEGTVPNEEGGTE